MWWTGVKWLLELCSFDAWKVKFAVTLAAIAQISQQKQRQSSNSMSQNLKLLELSCSSYEDLAYTGKKWGNKELIKQTRHDTYWKFRLELEKLDIQKQFRKKKHDPFS